MTQQYKPRQPVEQRFWSKVDRSGECWLWTGSKTKAGYGTFNNAQSTTWSYAHRISYEWAYGAIPNKLFICHRCDNPACVRPDHLFLGTPADNVHDRDAKGRSYVKLTPAIVQNIYSMCKSGVSQREIAKRYDVNQSTISLIVSGKRRPRVRKVGAE